MEQEIRYCTTGDGVRIAYGTYGNDSLPPLVHMCANPWQEAIWGAAWGRACFEAFGRAQRLITLDPRGQGLSQRDVAPITLDSWVADVLAVADHLEIERFSLFAAFPSDAVGSVLAARHAGRVTHLVLWSPRVAYQGSRELGVSALANWSMYTRAASTSFFPSGPPEAQRWCSSSMRSGMSPAILAQQAAWAYDLEQLLPQLTMPVLVLHRKRAQITQPARVRAVASLIPNARLVMLDGDVGLPYWDHEQFIRILDDFVGVEPGRPATLPHGTAISSSPTSSTRPHSPNASATPPSARRRARSMRRSAGSSAKPAAPRSTASCSAMAC